MLLRAHARLTTHARWSPLTRCLPRADTTLQHRACLHIDHTPKDVPIYQDDLDSSIVSLPASTSESTPESIAENFHVTHTRHVLRGILRECTYFPDHEASQWIRQHAIKRYREYSIKVREHQHDADYDERLQTIRRKARQAMYQLQRANEGDRKMMLKALNMAYGRTGKRRRELMAELVDSPNDQATRSDALVQHGPAQGTSEAQTRAFINALPAPLHALMISQRKSSPPETTRRNPKSLTPVIPELNSWYKPMPACRIRNKIAAHHAKVLDALQPPLPKHEWERLRKLAAGEAKFAGPAVRGKKLAPEPTALEMVVLKGKVPERMFRKPWEREITARFMRRCWREVFEQCPMLELEKDGKWMVTWGHRALHDKPVAKEEPASESQEANAPATAQASNVG